MEQSLIQYYESSFDMFASDGWKYLLEDLEKLKEQVANIRTVEDAQQLHFRQGQIDIIDLLLNRAKTCEEVYEQLKDETQ
jgi:hypothetical protein